VVVAPLLAGIFYFLVIVAQTLGYGTDAAGVKAYSTSAGPFSDLSKTYAGAALRDLINLGAMVSAFASALGTAVGGSRVLFAMSRDASARSPLGRASPRTGAPAGALAVVMVIAVGVVVIQRIVGTSAVNAFFYPGVIGVLSLLVAYIVTNLGAIRFLWIGARRAPLWQIPIPLIAIAILVYTIDKQVSGQTFPYDRFPWVVAGWLALSLVVVLAAPGLARRLGAGLARREGLAIELAAKGTGAEPK
jgi:amino acid transporter